MNLRDLHYLTAVAETKHFGQAAERCFVSQPTLSMQLKKLEDELGVQVFERSNKQVVITPIGEQIVAQAREVLQEANKLKQLAKQAQDPLSGILRVGIIPTVAPYLLSHVLRPIQEAFPNLELILHEDKTAVITQQLMRGELDAAILALPIAEPSLQIEPLYSEPFYLLSAVENKLAKEEKVAVADLKNEKLLLLAEGHCLRDQALDICHTVGLKEVAAFQATSLETLRQMVAMNAGVTLMPKLALNKENKGVSAVAFSEPVPHREMGLLYRSNSARKIACVAVAKLMSETVKKVLS